jgi:L-arabinokinase
VTFVFYISGHGFGHAARQVEIVNALGARVPGARVIIRSAVSPDLLARTLRVPYELRPGPCDSGIVQSSSVAHDDEATIDAALAFYRHWPARIRAEAERLGGDAPTLVVGDIPPLAFEVAASLGVPAIAVGNFTWDWIYAAHPGFADRAAHLLPLIREAYGRAGLALELPMSGGFDVFGFGARRTLPFVARRPSRPRGPTRHRFGLPAERRVALLSFGGYGLPDIDLARVDAPGWTIVTTDRVSGRDGGVLPGHVVLIEERAFTMGGFRYEDLVGAVDVVISKPGYGIIAECIAARTALLYTSRGAFREYDVLVAEMPRYLRSRFISQDDLFGGRWREALAGVLAQPAPPERPRVDGAEVAADAIVSRAASR